MTPKRSLRSSASSRRWACVSHPAPTVTCAEIGEAGRDLPDVQVVYLDDVVLRGEHAADLVRVEVARRGLEQHPPGLAEQREAGTEHQSGHDERSDAVRARVVRDEHDRARDRRGDEGEQVREHVREGALEVEAAPLRAGQHHRGGQVHGDPGKRHREHDAALHVGRVHEPPDALDHDHYGERDERGTVQLRGQDLRAPEPEREAAVGGPAREPRREQRERDRAGVGEHVGRVGEQCERVGQDAGRHLDGHQAENQGERECEAARVVRVDVGVAVGVHGQFGLSIGGYARRMSGTKEAAMRGVGLAAAALLHAGRSLEWQMRTQPGRRCRELCES